MKCNKGYKFRIYPNDQQKVLIAKTFGCARLVYNYLLIKNKEEYTALKERQINNNAQKSTQDDETKKLISYKKFGKELTELKRNDEYKFLKEVDSIALQQAFRHLVEAYKRFFKIKKVGYPRVKRKDVSRNNSYSTMLINNNIKIDSGCIILPKLGRVKMIQHRDIPEDYILKSATISKTPCGHYYVSITFEYESNVKDVELEKSLGLDFSMPDLYVDNEGNVGGSHRYYRDTQEKLAKAQKKLSRMVKGSKHYEKQRIAVAKILEKQKNQRKDALHKKSTKLANSYDCICVEDLNMKDMSKRLKFAKAVHDNGWGMFREMLAYKLADRGRKLIKIGKRFPSTQLCNCCGFKNPAANSLEVREWTCPECGAHHNRDINAAINIMREGMRIAREQINELTKDDTESIKAA